MKTYMYVDHNVKGEYYIYQKSFKDGKVVFICYASTILEADSQYKAQLNTDPSKQPHVGCTSFDPEDYKPVQKDVDVLSQEQKTYLLEKFSKFLKYI